jgi:hypothetical protein
MAVRIATMPGLIVPILISDREADILPFEILDEEVRYRSAKTWNHDGHERFLL